MPLSIGQINGLVRTPVFTGNCWDLINSAHQLRGLPALPEYPVTEFNRCFAEEIATGRWQRCKYAPHWGIARTRSSRGGHLAAIEGQTVIETTANSQRITATPLPCWQAKQAAPVRYYRRAV